MATISQSIGQGGYNTAVQDIITIQTLLNKVPSGEGGPDPKLIVEGKNWGPNWGKTKAAIVKFQKAKFKGWSDGRIDPERFGGMTMKELNKYERPAPGHPHSPTPTTIQVIPFHEPAPFLISKKGHSLSKGDLTSTPGSTTIFPPLVRLKVEAARRFSTADLEEAMLIELGGLGGPAGMKILDDFNKNSVARRTIPHGVGGILSNMVKASPEFVSEHGDVKIFINDALLASASTGILDYRALAAAKGKVPPPDVSYSGVSALHVLIGSFQGVNVFLTDFSASGTTRTYRADLTYELIDHFGVDDGDVTFDFRGHGSPGQVAFWVLQRERHPGHMPYITSVVINETISDSF